MYSLGPQLCCWDVRLAVCDNKMLLLQTIVIITAIANNTQILVMRDTFLGTKCMFGIIELELGPQNACISSLGTTNSQFLSTRCHQKSCNCDSYASDMTFADVELSFKAG